MQATLSPQSVELVNKLVKSGRYHDAEEVIAEALLVLEEQERLEALHAAIAIGDAFCLSSFDIFSASGRSATWTGLPDGPGRPGIG